MRHTILTATLLAGIAAGAAWVQGVSAQQAAGGHGVAEAIAQRQAGFKAISANTGDIKKVIDAGGDLAAVASKAEAIGAEARRVASLFPAGSGAESGIKTRALPALWQNKPHLEATAAALARDADRLAVVLKANDKAGASAAFAAMTSQCGTCHRPYRAPQ